RIAGGLGRTTRPLSPGDADATAGDTLMPHNHNHAFQSFNAKKREGLVLHSRRNFLKASLAGIAGLTVPHMLRSQAQAAAAGLTPRTNKSVILLWMGGGPSHIDMWDMK